MLRNKYNLIFAALLISVLATFFYLRPLKSAWHPFIAGDGLGYYAYLPAKFIYHDTDLNFKWFNSVYKAHYLAGTFENAEDNLLVEHNGKKINKYYPGLSFIWLPFFFAGHLLAKVLHEPADGFSLPYQWAMGLASLFYLFLGLIFLRKLLLLLFKDQIAALLVPFFIFFGTHLFSCAISTNTLSHVYSFTFSVVFIYYTCLFFMLDKNPMLHFLLAATLFLVSACIRPFNVLLLLVVPAFMSRKTLGRSFRRETWKIEHLLILVAVILVLCWQFWNMYVQTGSLFVYTYNGETFDPGENRFFSSLFSYNIGLFVYVPLMVVSAAGAFFLKKRTSLVLSFVFLFILFLYSSWWYWPIVKRAMIDWYAIPAIFLGALVSKFPARKMSTIVLLVVCVLYYQFKEYQVRNGILDEYLTYREIFWRNFFRTAKGIRYLVPPESIMESQKSEEGFESGTADLNSTSEKVYSGKRSLLLDRDHSIALLGQFRFPAFFDRPAVKKIKFSLWCNAEEGLSTIHYFIEFRNKNGVPLLQVPFYVNKDGIPNKKWELMEFGYQMEDTSAINNRTVDRIAILAWNVEGKRKLYIDDLCVEFLLLNNRFETLK
jgi:hypothetical protein